MAVKREYPQTQEFSEQAAISLAGCAYEKKVCTKAQAAWNINYHAKMFNGEYSAEAIEEIHHYYKKNVKLID